jgi:hypothetical protein
MDLSVAMWLPTVQEWQLLGESSRGAGSFPWEASSSFSMADQLVHLVIVLLLGSY